MRNSPSTCCKTEKCNTHHSGRSGAAPWECPPSCGQTGGFSAADLRPQHLPRDLQTQHHGPAVGKSLTHTHTEYRRLNTMSWLWVDDLVFHHLFFSSPGFLFPSLSGCRIYSLNTPGIISCTCKWSCVWHPSWTTLSTPTSRTQVCRITRRDHQLLAQAPRRRREHLARTAAQIQQTHQFKMPLLLM